MSYRAVAVTIMLVLLFFSTACSRKRSISIKAAIVYKMGGAQPVARVPFYLLRDDPEKMLRASGDESYQSLERIVRTCAFNEKFPEGGNGTGLDEQTLDKIRPTIVESVTTDFDGTAMFKPVESGTYYLFAMTALRSGCAGWNQKIVVEGQDQNIVLDQNNAETHSF